MASVAVHPPKTPITKGSNGIASATLPNVCKMPGPPAPFVPSPLPNIAKSGSSPKDYTKKVKVEGNTVAVGGASFQSMGDMASKGTGGGLVSANTHGPIKFIMPGSMTVTYEGKAVHLLGEPVLNNCGPSGSPPNTGATMTGTVQGTASAEELLAELKKIACECDAQIKQASPKKKQKTCRQLGVEKHDCCEKAIKKKDNKQLEGEKGYGPKPNHTPLSASRNALLRQGKLRGTCWPDATITSKNGTKKFVDFKFRCPPNTPVKKKKKNRWVRTGPTGPKEYPGWTQYKDGSTQEDKYKAVGRAQKPPVKGKPELITNEGC